MTAATSTKNNSYFGKRFSNRLAESRKLFVVNSVFSLLGLPLLSLIFVLVMYFEQNNKNVYENFTPDGYLALGICALFASFAMGIVIALSNFRYLYQKQLVDMNYALPLNSKQRFFADYLSGLVTYLVPIACGTIISYIIILAGENNLKEKILTPALGHLTASGLIVVVGLIMLYTFSVLGIVFAGSTFEAVFSIVAVNAMIPATVACLWIAMISSSSFGIDEESIIRSLFLTSTSPVGVGIFFGDILSDGTFLIAGRMGGEYTNFFYFRGLFCAAVVTAAAVFLAYFLYKKRKAEDVSKPYVFKGFYYGVMILAVFCILSLFISQDENVIPGIIICAVGWFLMELITRRGFKKFWTAGVGFVLTVGLVFGACAVCKATEGFGAAKKIPSASSVKSVSVYSHSGNGFSGRYDVKITDPQVIESVIALHKEIVDTHFNSDYNNYETGEFDMDNPETTSSLVNVDDSITIEYTLKSGSKISRSYSIITSMETEVLESILLSDEYAESVSESMFLDMANNETNGDHWYRTYSEAKKKAEHGYAPVMDKFNLTGDTLSLSNSEMQELCNAYNNDLRNMTREDLESYDVYCNICGNWVLDTFAETKAFLNSMGYEAPEIDKDYIKSNSKSFITVSSDFTLVSHLSQNMKGEFRDYQEYDYHQMDIEQSMTVISSNYTSYYGYVYNDNMGSKIEFDSDEAYANTIALLENSSGIIINEKPAAILSIGHQNFYLPDTPENRDILEALDLN